jgi:asparagine synthase (glutamine-hydrolysing)
MAHSLELRVPLLDSRIVEFVAGLPGAAKMSRQRPKPLLAGALAGLIPDEVSTRKKLGFTLPFASMMMKELLEPVGDLLADKDFGGQVGAALEPELVAETWQDFLKGRTNWLAPWSLYVAKSWGQQHLP